MQPRQTLADLTATVVRAMTGVLETHKPDWLVVQGDTTTAFVASLASFYGKIPVAHVRRGCAPETSIAPMDQSCTGARSAMTGAA